MSASLVALLATAIHQAGNPEGDPIEIDRTLALLARASEGNPVTLEVVNEGVKINGLPVVEPAPGAMLLSEALASHDTSRVQLPGSLESRHWREIADLFAAAPGLFPTSVHVLAALRISLPSAELWGSSSNGTPSLVPPLANAQARENPLPSNADVTTRAGHLGSFSAELSALNAAGTAAAQQENVEELARVLLGFHALEKSVDTGQTVIIAKERRRVLSPSTLRWMLHEAAKMNVSSAVPQAIGTLSGEDAEAVLEAVGRSTSPRERDALLRCVDLMPDLQGIVALALRGGGPMLARGAAEVAGRKQMAATIPALALLLRHGDEGVRTTAWRALEAIGTREAIEAISSKGR